ncbi:MAG: tRNA (5-methylaminomethyl-2-thiouridine)(34)-methyltransferase MnmD [Bacteroidota bacterium]
MSNTGLIRTEDGSHTLFDAKVGEHYHSIHGAIRESVHVFVSAGFNWIASRLDKLNILEIGFGTGLNCLLSLAESVKLNKKVSYTSLEPFPITADLYTLLNYCEFEGLSDYNNEFLKMHGKNEGVSWLSPGFELNRLCSTFEVTVLEPACFDLVYFDAFSPEVQPGLWLPETFIKIRRSMKQEGVLVTYSAKGSVRRALQQSGFRTERLAGPPGKREMLRAIAV